MLPVARGPARHGHGAVGIPSLRPSCRPGHGGRTMTWIKAPVPPTGDTTSMETQPATPPPLSPAMLARAPHRLLFFIGAANVLLAMLWWALWLVEARWHALGLSQPQVYGGWLHAIVMQYHVLAPFMFGFLLTVFPRWMGQDDLTVWHY